VSEVSAAMNSTKEIKLGVHCTCIYLWKQSSQNIYLFIYLSK
jgi:hypothetical protein